ncbi:MAG: hypothetical protein ACI97A_000750 [Planctomycetota bacterium]
MLRDGSSLKSKPKTKSTSLSWRGYSRVGLRTTWRLICIVCVLYTFAHVADALYYWSYTPLSARVFQDEASLSQVLEIDPGRAPLVASIAEVLSEDKIPEAELWAAAIGRHIPTDDVGYASLVMAQIRRESHFNAPDLEWLYDHVVPDLLHDSGLVRNQVNTVGPMQINRNQLLRLMRKNGEDIDYPEGPAFSKLVTEIDTGVRYAVQYLDKIVLDYIPARQIGGWSDFVGHRGYGLEGEVNQPIPSDMAEFRDRERIASYQKMVSDLAGSPLVLDGVIGDNTYRVSKQLALNWPKMKRQEMLAALAFGDDQRRMSDTCFDLVAQRWQSVFGSEVRRVLYPRISHDPRLVFILADFNAGVGSCRIAALQQMLNVLHQANLDVDGKYGPNTLAAIRSYVTDAQIAATQKRGFLRLIESQSKLNWVRAAVTKRLQQEWQDRFGMQPPLELCPEIWTEHFNQQKRRIQRLSTWDYVSASTRFFENYHLRLRQKLDRKHF